MSILSNLLIELFNSFFLKLNLFDKIVGDKTKGDEAVWYAPSDKAEFQFIVKVTGICNVFLFSSLFFFLGKVIYKM